MIISIWYDRPKIIYIKTKSRYNHINMMVP